MTKPFMRITSSFILTVAAIMLIKCVDTPDEPMRWRQKFEIPITNESFIMGEQFENLFNLEGMDILRVDSTYRNDPRFLSADTIKGDTVVFSAHSSDTSSFETHEDSLELKTFHVAFGPIPINSAADIRRTVPYVPGPVPLAIPLTDIYAITFDSESAQLKMSVTNNTSATLTNISVNFETFGTQSISSLAAGATDTLRFVVADKAIDSIANLTLTSSVGSGLVGAGQTIELGISFAGLTASSLRVTDRLVALETVFYNDYKVTDTVAIDYIDVKDGFFLYSIDNKTGVDLKVRGKHEHLWQRVYCEQKNLTSVADLAATGLDSISYAGNFTQGDVKAVKNTFQRFNQLNLSGTRLFTLWNDSNSITRVRYLVAVDTSGQKITMTKNDSLVFTIETRVFKFNQMRGTLKEDYARQSDTQKIAIPFPWKNTPRESLRDHFVLSKVFGDVAITPDMPQGAVLDTFIVNLKIFDPTTPAVICSTQARLIGLRGDTSYIVPDIDITKIVNLFPDSVYIIVGLNVPKESRMIVVNDLTDANDPDYNKYIGRMIVDAEAKFRLNALLDWEVKDSLTMDLGLDSFPIIDALRLIRKLEDKQVSFNMDLLNRTNIYMKLYALIAPKHLIGKLDSMKTPDVSALLTTPGAAESAGFVNFLGTSGIDLPKRDTRVLNSIVLNNSQLDTIFSTDTCAWRWQLRFAENDRDALSDTDFVRINSWLHIEGINNTDSLLIW